MRSIYVLIPVSAHDSKVYIFRGKYIWRVDDYYGVDEGFPKLIRKVYDNPPKNLGAAVYSWRTRYTYFYKGQWREPRVKSISPVRCRFQPLMPGAVLRRSRARFDINMSFFFRIGNYIGG